MNGASFPSMTKKEGKIRTEKQFALLFRKGRAVHDGGCMLRFLRNTVGRTRVAYVVGSKVSKLAVERNLLRRRIREAYIKEKPNVLPGFDIVFFARPEMKNRPYADVAKSVHALLERARLIRPTR